MGEPTDDEINAALSFVSSSHDTSPEFDATFFALVEDLQRHRAAQTANAERVRAVVREAIDHSRHLPHGQAERAIADRVAAQLAAPPPVSAADRAQIERWLVGRAEDGYACEALDRLLHALDGHPPPGHVCPVPYGLGPDDLDILKDLADMVTRDDLAIETAGSTRTRAVLDRILAAHRAPGVRS